MDVELFLIALAVLGASLILALILHVHSKPLCPPSHTHLHI